MSSLPLIRAMFQLKHSVSFNTNKLSTQISVISQEQRIYFQQCLLTTTWPDTTVSTAFCLLIQCHPRQCTECSPRHQHCPQPTHSAMDPAASTSSVSDQTEVTFLDMDSITSEFSPFSNSSSHPRSSTPSSSTGSETPGRKYKFLSVYNHMQALQIGKLPPKSGQI